jgi:hypothetical protein
MLSIGQPAYLVVCRLQAGRLLGGLERSPPAAKWIAPVAVTKM